MIDPQQRWRTLSWQWWRIYRRKLAPSNRPFWPHTQTQAGCQWDASNISLRYTNLPPQQGPLGRGSNGPTWRHNYSSEYYAQIGQRVLKRFQWHGQTAQMRPMTKKPTWQPEATNYPTDLKIQKWKCKNTEIQTSGLPTHWSDCLTADLKIQKWKYKYMQIQKKIQKYRNTWQYLTTDLKTQTLKYMYMQIQKYKNTEIQTSGLSTQTGLTRWPLTC